MNSSKDELEPLAGHNDPEKKNDDEELRVQSVSWCVNLNNRCCCRGYSDRGWGLSIIMFLTFICICKCVVSFFALYYDVGTGSVATRGIVYGVEALVDGGLIIVLSLINKPKSSIFPLSIPTLSLNGLIGLIISKITLIILYIILIILYIVLIILFFIQHSHFVKKSFNAISLLGGLQLTSL